jgi:DNA-binding response OmpR family regulator
MTGKSNPATPSIEVKGLNDMDFVQMMSNAPSRYQDAHLEVDFDCRVATLDSRPLALTPKECDLLVLLVQNAGAIVSREELLTRVWGYCKEVRTRTVHVHISRLRKHLSPYGMQYIETISGTGYRFQPIRPIERFRLPLPVSELALTA